MNENEANYKKRTFFKVKETKYYERKKSYLKE